MRGQSAAVSALALATLLWGATFVVIRDTVSGLDPIVLVFTRFAVAAAIFAALTTMRGLGPTREVWAQGAVAGVLMAGGYLFQAIGLTRASAGSSAFLTSVGTLFAGVFAWPLLGQRPGAMLAAGLALAALGSALLAAPSGLTLGAGEAWTLLGAVSFALQVVVLARVAPRVDPLALALVQSLAVAFLLAPFAYPHLGAIRSLHGVGWWRVGYLIVAGSVIAPLLQIVAQRSLPAGRVGLLFALEPVFALGFAVTVGGERFQARWWWGAALILLAVLVVEGAAARRAATKD